MNAARNVQKLMSRALPWSALALMVCEGAIASGSPPKGVTPSRFAPLEKSTVALEDYVYAGVAFDVLEATSLSKAVGCEELRLMVPASEVSELNAASGPKTNMMLLNTQGSNVFECSGGPLAAQLRFIVKSGPENLQVTQVDFADGTYNLEWSEQTQPTHERLAKIGRDSEGKHVDEHAVLVREIAHSLLKGFVRHEAALEKTLWTESESAAKTLAGSIDRYYWTGGYYDNVWYGRPTLYKSPWINHGDLDSGSSCTQTSYNFLASTQTATGTSTGDDCGHMLANRLGGSGRVYNGDQDAGLIFTQSSTVNRGAFAQHEAKVYKIIDEDACGVTSSAWIELQFHYDNYSQKRVVDEHYTTRCRSTNATCRARMQAQFGTSFWTYTHTKWFDNP